MRVGCALVIAACGGTPSAPRPASPPQQTPSALGRVDPHATGSATARAEATLRSDLVLDYQRPFNGAAVDRTPTAKLFADVCKQGDKRACIIEAELRPAGDARTTYAAVLTHCMAGDTISCRALPADDDAARFPEAPGAMSRRTACQNRKPTCDVAVLRHECDAGFPAACVELSLADPSSPDSDALAEKSLALSVEGCEHAISSECQSVTQYGPQDQARFDRVQRLCDLSPQWCTSLADEYKARSDARSMRGALERACEYGPKRFNTCAELGAMYLTRELEEPVPGRGQQLVDWACPQLLALPGHTVKLHPACKSAKRP